MAKVYSNLHVDGSFIYNNNPQSGYVLTTDENGLVSWTASSALISVASSTEFGHLKIGDSLTVNNLGVANIATASDSKLGGVIVGTGLTVSNGVLSVSGSVGNYLPLSGGTMSGDIQLDSNKLIGNNTDNYIQLNSLYQYYYYDNGAGYRSSIINNSGVELKGGLSDNTLYGDVIVGDTNTIIRSTKNGYNSSLTLTGGGYSSGGSTVSAHFEDSINNIGIVYTSDYSANFVDNSLITKKYVDTSISNISISSTTYSAGLGLTLSGATFSLIAESHKIIYVSVNGSDSNNGLNELMPVLNLWKARDLANAGDTVVVMPGSYIFDNRNSAGCPYNGLVQTKVNLWKNGVSYYFMPGAKIYSYGSTSGSYSPYSDDMIFFQPNSLTYSECSVLGYLEFYTISEGADNNGGSAYLFSGEENAGTWPGYRFDLQAKVVDATTGCTVIRAIRTTTGASASYINIEIDTAKFAYTTGQSSAGAWSTWRGAETFEMVVNIKIKNVISGGTGDKSLFQIRPNGTKSMNNYLKINIIIDYADFNGYSHLVNYTAHSLYGYSSPSYVGTSVSSGYVNLHVEKCIFSSSLIRLLLNLTNYYINISGNYYDSGTMTSTYTYSTYVGGTNKFGNAPFILMPDVANDGLPDYGIVNFTGNLYMKNPTRHAVWLGSLPNVGTVYSYFGLMNMKLNFRGDIYFNLDSDYTGDLFFVGMGKLVYSGNINGVNSYLGGTYSFSVYGINSYAGNELGPGFAGNIIRFGSHKAYATLENCNILTSTNKQSLLLSPATYQSAYGDPTLNIYNSNIKLYATASVLADGSYLNCFVENSTIRNYGTKEIFYNPVSSGVLQILNSTFISNGTYSTIDYSLGTVSSAGGYSNKDILFSTLNGTVSVASFLV